MGCGVGAEVLGRQAARVEDLLGDVVQERRVALEHPFGARSVESLVADGDGDARDGGADDEGEESE